MDKIALKNEPNLNNVVPASAAGPLDHHKTSRLEGLAAEERALQKVESTVERRYQGIRGNLRLFEISRVIAMLSLYLYLDQLDVHQKHQNKLKAERRTRAMRL